MGYIPVKSFMLAIDRISEIEAKYQEKLERIVILELDGETIRLILYLEDDTNLRVAEQLDGQMLKRYSYYWLTTEKDFSEWAGFYKLKKRREAAI